MEDLGVYLNLGFTIFAVGVAWGISQGKIKANKEAVIDLKETVKDLKSEFMELKKEFTTLQTSMIDKIHSIDINVKILINEINNLKK